MKSSIIAVSFVHRVRVPGGQDSDTEWKRQDGWHCTVQDDGSVKLQHATRTMGDGKAKAPLAFTVRGVGYSLREDV